MKLSGQVELPKIMKNRPVDAGPRTMTVFDRTMAHGHYVMIQHAVRKEKGRTDLTVGEVVGAFLTHRNILTATGKEALPRPVKVASYGKIWTMELSNQEAVNAVHGTKSETPSFGTMRCERSNRTATRFSTVEHCGIATASMMTDSVTNAFPGTPFVLYAVSKYGCHTGSRAVEFTTAPDVHLDVEALVWD